MKKLLFTFSLTNLAGEEILGPDGKKITAGDIMSNNLVSISGNSDNAMKFYDWATTIYHGKELVLDSSDFKRLRDFVESNQALTILTKGQIIRYMDSVNAEA